MPTETIWLSPASISTLIASLQRIRQLNQGPESIKRCDGYIDRLRNGLGLTRGMLSWIKSNCVYWSLPQVPAMADIVLDTKSRNWFKKHRPHPGPRKVHHSAYNNHRPNAEIVGAPTPKPVSSIGIREEMRRAMEDPIIVAIDRLCREDDDDVASVPQRFADPRPETYIPKTGKVHHGDEFFQ